MVPENSDAGKRSETVGKQVQECLARLSLRLPWVRQVVASTHCSLVGSIMEFISQLCALRTKQNTLAISSSPVLMKSGFLGADTLFISGLCRGGSQGVGRESHNVGHVRGFWSDTEEVSNPAEKPQKSAFIISNHCGTLSTPESASGHLDAEWRKSFISSFLPPSLHLSSPFPSFPFLPFLSFFKPKYINLNISGRCNDLVS